MNAMNAKNADKAFAIYAFGLIGGLLCVLSATVVSGIGEAPSLGFMLEHLALGLLIRGSYKSFDGSNWVRDFLEYTGMIIRRGEEAMTGGGLANAA